MTKKTAEKTLARSLQAARGEGASYARALHDLRECLIRGDDPVAFMLAEGAVIPERSLTREAASHSQQTQAG